MNDIKSTIFNITKNVSKTGGDLFKTTKLNINLASEENNLKSLYTEIGKKVHEIYQYGGSLGKFFDEKYMEIEACERKISEIKEQIGSIKGVRVCAKCGKTIDRASGFCPKCGVRIEEVRSDAEVSEPGLPDEQYSRSEPAPQHSPLPPAPVTESPPPMPPAPPQMPQAPVPLAKSCRVCNASNESGTKFCISCGRLLD